jgi:hypothetical protein
VENQLLEAQQGVGRVEDAQADLLSPLGRKGGDAEIDGAFFQPHADAALLGKSPFRRVELGENLEARGQAYLNLLGEYLDRLERPVDAEAHGEFFFLRLQVNIAGAPLDGERQKAIRHANDRRVGGGQREVRNALAPGPTFPRRQGFERFVLERREDALQRVRLGGGRFARG